VTKLASKNIDVADYKSRISKCRDKMRSCLFEIHKSKKELKDSLNASKEAINSKISEMRAAYNSIKAELRLLFKEMESQYKSTSRAV
jgi:uncharacterized coiled-coil DUF342 family protein